jgi:hypothetical protein
MPEAPPRPESRLKAVPRTGRSERDRQGCRHSSCAHGIGRDQLAPVLEHLQRSVTFAGYGEHARSACAILLLIVNGTASAPNKLIGVALLA